VFYEPLAQVYKDANITDFVLKISLFIDDLIQVIQKVNSNTTDLTSKCGHVQHFIDLVSRHEQEFYTFVHSVYSSKSNDLFHSLLNWGDSLLSAIRDKVIFENLDMQRFVDENVETHVIDLLKSDLNNLESYHFRRKQRQMRNLQKKLLDTEPDEITELELMLQNTQNASIITNSDQEQLQSSTNPNLSASDHRQSVIDFGFGNLTLDDIRDLHEETILTTTRQYGALNSYNQALVNADPSEPMLVWLNTHSTSNPKEPSTVKSTDTLGADLNPNLFDLESVSVSSATSDKSNASNSNEKLQNIEEIPRRISKFVAPKTIAHISQEPYPDNIKILPTLVAPFLSLVTQVLKN